MKNVLFTTTAIAGLALSTAAFAGGHASGNIGLSGSTDVGYNDDIEGGIFQETNIDIKASKDAGNGFTVGGHVRLNLDWYEGAGESTSLEFKSIYVDTPVGKLEYADSFDGTGASDSFYKDRDGMAEDMTNGDGHAGLKWSGEAGDFGYAVDIGNLDDSSTVTGEGDHYTVGLGGSFGDVTVGFGWENNSHEGATIDQVLGLSVDFAAGPLSVGASYIDSGVETSTGIAVSAEVAPGFTVGAYYAMNDAADDAYGVSFDYVNGPLTVAVDYDDGNGATTSNYEIDVSYAVNDMVTLYVGTDEADGSYAGVEVAVADGIKATIAYAEADEIGGPEFKDGTTAMLSLTY